MLRMSQVHVVRHKVLVEGASQREAAEQMGLSRNTVARYVGETVPERASYPRRVKPVADLVRPRLDALFDEWGHRTTRKQRITAERLLRQLREEGFEVGRTTVSDYLREKRRLAAEVFIPLIHRPGDAAAVDFFEVSVEVAGVVRKVWKFLMRLMCSGYDFVWLYEHCDQLAFLDGHVRAFSYFHGVPRRGIYDNLTAAVHFKLGLSGERERELSDRFAALAAHYLFEPCFARPGQGHDKGGVEARGKAIRFQHLVPIPKGDSLEEIATRLLEEVSAAAGSVADRDGRTARDRYEAERESLREVPPYAFDVRRFVPVTVSSQSTVRIEGALYSVPCEWARLSASAYVGVSDIRVACQGQVRIFEKAHSGQRQIRYRDYLPELARKPQAVRQVAPELVAELGEVWGRLWALLVSTHGEREASRIVARLLGVVVKAGLAPVSDQLAAALSGEVPDVRVLARLLHAEDAPRAVEVPEALAAYSIESARATDYDVLMAGGDR
jgi:transposase